MKKSHPLDLFSEQDVMNDFNKKLIPVCSACLKASCWLGVFLCENAKTADVVEKPVHELRELSLEHPNYWRKALEAPRM